MYSFSSASHIRDPRPLTMKGGSPPTARKARTGEFTPPGKSLSARSCSFRERSVLRVAAGCMGMVTIAASSDYDRYLPQGPRLRPAVVRYAHYGIFVHLIQRGE